MAPIHRGNSEQEIAAQLQAIQPRIMLVHTSETGFEPSREISLESDDAAVTREQEAGTPDSREAVAMRIYTSGSTGRPKIVRLSHRNIITNVLAACNFQPFGPHDRFLSLLPFSHAMGMTANLMLPLYAGSCTITPKVLAANEILAALGEEKISVLVAVPRLFRNIMNGLEKKFRESSALLRAYVGLLRCMPLPLRRVMNAPLRNKLGGRINCWVSGGSHLDGRITRYFHRLGIPLRQGYGLTETSPIATLQDEFDEAVESVGKPIEDVSATVLHPDPSGSGEIGIKGPNVMLGYEDAGQNAEAFEDGWYRTGDIGTIDAQGRVTLTGRSKRLIVTEAGKNVYPEELEILLERDPRVKEAGVFELDMKPVCVISTDEESPAAAIRSVLGDYNGAVSPHNRITRFAITDELPRTPLGKLALQKLPEVFSEKEVTQ